MKDIYNPTNEEIRQWAYEADAAYPTQDWDIIVFHDVSEEDDDFNRLILELASDPDCPSQHLFLGYLELMTHNFVGIKKGCREKKLAKITMLIEMAEKSTIPEVLEWAQKAKKGIEDKSFSYKYYNGW